MSANSNEKINTRELEVKVLDREVKSGKDKGKKFKAYKVLNKSQEWVDLKFRQEVTNLPKEDCIIVVRDDQMNYRSREQVKYPVLWVKKVEEIKPKYQPEDYDKELPF